MTMYSNQMHAEDEAARLSKESPNQYMVCVFHNQVYQWMIMPASSAIVCIDSGYVMESQAIGYLRGYLAPEWKNTPIDQAYWDEKGEIACRSWINSEAADKDLEVTETYWGLALLDRITGECKIEYSTAKPSEVSNE